MAFNYSAGSGILQGIMQAADERKQKKQQILDAILKDPEGAIMAFGNDINRVSKLPDVQQRADQIKQQRDIDFLSRLNPEISSQMAGKPLTPETLLSASQGYVSKSDQIRSDEIARQQKQQGIQNILSMGDAAAYLEPSGSATPTPTPTGPSQMAPSTSPQTQAPQKAGVYPSGPTAQRQPGFGSAVKPSTGVIIRSDFVDPDSGLNQEQIINAFQQKVENDRSTKVADNRTKMANELYLNGLKTVPEGFDNIDPDDLDDVMGAYNNIGMEVVTEKDSESDNIWLKSKYTYKDPETGASTTVIKDIAAVPSVRGGSGYRTDYSNIGEPLPGFEKFQTAANRWEFRPVGSTRLANGDIITNNDAYNTLQNYPGYAQWMGVSSSEIKNVKTPDMQKNEYLAYIQSIEDLEAEGNTFGARKAREPFMKEFAAISNDKNWLNSKFKPTKEDWDNLKRSLTNAMWKTNYTTYDPNAKPWDELEWMDRKLNTSDDKPLSKEEEKKLINSMNWFKNEGITSVAPINVPGQVDKMPSKPAPLND